MPTNTDAPRERIISDFNRDLFGDIYFSVELQGRSIPFHFPDTDSIRRFAADLISESKRFDASGA